MDVIVNYLKGIIEELPHLLDTTKPTIFYQNGDFRISSTIVTTWIMMLLLFIFVIIITSKLERISKTRRQAIAEKMTMFFYGFVYDVLGEKLKNLCCFRKYLYYNIVNEFYVGNTDLYYSNCKFQYCFCLRYCRIFIYSICYN